MAFQNEHINLEAGKTMGWGLSKNKFIIDSNLFGYLKTF